MKKISLTAGLFISCILTSCFAFEELWEGLSRENTDIRTVLVCPENPRVIYFGSGKGVFKSEDTGLNWRNILSVKGANRAVNFLTFDPADKNSIYAATGNGLFKSENQGSAWKRIFKGKNSFENECAQVAVLPCGIYLGTQEALFISSDKGRSWHKAIGKVGNSRILAIAYDVKENNRIYVASVAGIFETKDAGKSWEKIFIAYPAENGLDAEDNDEDPDEGEKLSDIRYITLDAKSQTLYLATSRGVLASGDKGKSWAELSDYGLLKQDVQFLLNFGSRLFCASESAVYEYSRDRWHELSFGLAVAAVNSLAIDNQNNLYAASVDGLFRARIDHVKESFLDSAISDYSRGEPSINEIQQAAIKYAEVAPEKILDWRKKASKKAFLPQISMGVGRNVTDLWHWESGSTTKADDDILKRGRDAIEWDVTLAWDLSEIVWNNDQTSIDARSRLMVELREDILDEVTKLYFERIRVKMELDSLSIEERKKKQEKELRLRELGAHLDALTGGYFSHKSY